MWWIEFAFYGVWSEISSVFRGQVNSEGKSPLSRDRPPVRYFYVGKLPNISLVFLSEVYDLFQLLCYYLLHLFVFLLR